MYFKDSLRHRQSWLGVALLLVILFHLPFDMGFFNHIKNIGYCGVDICFFASGIGCFFSLSSDSDVGNFMKRRFIRLFPTYLIFIVCWLVLRYFSGEFDLQMALGNILTIQYFTGQDNYFNWYISALILFYFLAPYLKITIDRTKTIHKIFLLTVFCACSVPFWYSSTYLITVSRLPIFYIGMLFANICQKNKQISKKHIFSLIISFTIGILFLAASMIYMKGRLTAFGLLWYPFILIVPPFCVGISYVLTLLEKNKITKPLVSFLSLCGNYSFELYLIHIDLISAISLFTTKFNLSETNLFVWITGGGALVIGCFILRRLSIFFINLYKSIFHKST